MLKTVSSITNAIGALNFKGTWDANANSPVLTSSVGTKGDYYVVGTAGSTNLNGISNWGVGDLATFNGSVWQRVEGGADLNGVNLSVSGTSTLSGLTASTALALNASKEIVSVTNTGTGNNVLATAPTLVGNATLSTGNLIIGTSGKGVDFSATSGTGLSELLADYEEGVWTPTMLTTGTNFASITYDGRVAGKYVKIGQLVYVMGAMRTNSIDTTGATGTVAIGNLPFTVAAAQAGPLFDNSFPGSVANVGSYLSNFPLHIKAASGTTRLDLQFRILVGGEDDNLPITSLDTGLGKNYTSFACCYVAA
jgi:hypothetical protein